MNPETCSAVCYMDEHAACKLFECCQCPCHKAGTLALLVPEPPAGFDKEQEAE